MFLRTTQGKVGMAFSRTLTRAEQSVCEHVFRGSIDRAFLLAIEVVKRSDRVVHGGFTPYGRMTVGASDYEDDYVVDFDSPPRVESAHFFLHEMCHIWQHLMGMHMVIQKARSQRQMRKLLRAAGLPLTKDNKYRAEYEYFIEADKPDLLDYAMEFQCEIIADYFANDLWGRPIPTRSAIGFPPLASSLRSVLAKFLRDPAYARNEHRFRRLRGGARSL